MAKVKNGIFLETWNGKKVFVQRKNNQIETWRYQKGSRIKTRAEANEILSKNKTFREDKVRVTSKDYNSKTFETSENNETRVIQIGRNTGILKSERPVSETDKYQYIALVKWGDKERQTKGYSDFKQAGGTKEQAFDRAKGTAVSDKIITYEHKITWVSDTIGYAQYGNKAVYFSVTYEVQTYIFTAPND